MDVQAAASRSKPEDLMKKLEVLVPLLFAVVAVVAPKVEKVIPAPGSVESQAKALATLFGAAVLLALVVLYVTSESRRRLLAVGVLGFSVGAALALIYLLRYGQEPIFPSIVGIPADQVFALSYILHFDAWVACFAGLGLSAAKREAELEGAAPVTTVSDDRGDRPAGTEPEAHGDSGHMISADGVTAAEINEEDGKKGTEANAPLSLLLAFVLVSRWEDIRESAAAKGRFGFWALFARLAALILEPYSGESRSALSAARRGYRLLWLGNLIRWFTASGEVRKNLLQLANQTLSSLARGLDADRIRNESKDRVEILQSLGDKLEAVLAYPFFFGYDRLYFEFRDCMREAREIAAKLTPLERSKVTLVQIDAGRQLINLSYAALGPISVDHTVAHALALPLAEFRSGDWRDVAPSAYKGAEKVRKEIALSYPETNPARNSYLLVAGTLYGLAAASGTTAGDTVERALFSRRDAEDSLDKLIEIARLNYQERATERLHRELQELRQDEAPPPQP